MRWTVTAVVTTALALALAGPAAAQPARQQVGGCYALPSLGVEFCYTASIRVTDRAERGAYTWVYEEHNTSRRDGVVVRECDITVRYKFENGQVRQDRSTESCDQ